MKWPFFCFSVKTLGSTVSTSVPNICVSCEEEGRSGKIKRKNLKKSQSTTNLIEQCTINNKNENNEVTVKEKDNDNTEYQLTD